MSVDHNAITPIEELVENELIVAIGSDNIHDIYKPYSDGNMATELRVMLEATHFYNMKELIKIATTNGRQIIGVD
jgi:cytosine/adenosine deaminase-related metal-dependent hydrolase